MLCTPIIAPTIERWRIKRTEKAAQRARLNAEQAAAIVNTPLTGVTTSLNKNDEHEVQACIEEAHSVEQKD